MLFVGSPESSGDQMQTIHLDLTKIGKGDLDEPTD